MQAHRIISERFQCRHCGSTVALTTELGGDLSYQCQNHRCKWAGSVDCPEALALKPEASITPVITLATPQARKAAYNAAQGVKPVQIKHGYLVPSSSRGSVIHVVGTDGRCSCEAGRAGRACWHVALVALEYVA